MLSHAKSVVTRLVGIADQSQRDIIRIMALDNTHTYDSDEQLMLGYQSGELKAFETLYHRHKAAVYRFILRHGIDNNSAEELLQDIWSSVIKGRINYQPKAKFTTWLYQIARNRLIDYYRAHKEHLQLLDEEPGQDIDEQDYDGNKITEGFDKIHTIIHSLPFPQRQAFLLHYEAGLTVPEVAEITQEHTEAVKSRIRYAVQKLKQLLGVDDE